MSIETLQAARRVAACGEQTAERRSLIRSIGDTVGGHASYICGDPGNQLPACEKCSFATGDKLVRINLVTNAVVPLPGEQPPPESL